MEVVEVFRALGDPVRLEMVRRLAAGEPHTISTVSSQLNITRQGARKHLQVLVDAKIIALNPHGRDTEVRLLRDTLDQGKAFIANLELQWDKRLVALRTFVERRQ
ncbi:helix-turn-helix transcriptional regulator [Candidatus Microgenomates bacterium]|nr:helix-turn-helix transcriptional regulator [Candidatus Microgenomates bacterium]